MPFCKVTPTKEPHDANAESPMVSTVPGISISVSPVFVNAAFPIVVTVSLIEAEVIFEQPLNVYAPIVVTPDVTTTDSTFFQEG